MTVFKRRTSEDSRRICPLCSSSGPFNVLTSPLNINFHLCMTCQLIFMDSAYLPDWSTEKAEYLTHQNGPQYAGYVKFLSQAIAPTLPHLQIGMRGLDYGCGPGPTIHALLKDVGIHCENYDPFFFPTLPEGRFDFIFATEAVEHFFYPGQELNKIRDLLKPEGIFTIMTEAWDDHTDFSAWHYAKDITHVCFYHANTIDFICDSFGFAALDRENTRVSVLKKAAVPTSHPRFNGEVLPD